MSLGIRDTSREGMSHDTKGNFVGFWGDEMDITVSVVSLPIYERLVAEIWEGPRQVGLITNEEPNQYKAIIFSDEGEESLTLNYQDLMYGLALAFKQLQDIDIAP